LKRSDIKKHISALYDAGWTYSEIGRKLGITRDTVAGLVRRMHLPKRGGFGGWACREAA